MNKILTFIVNENNEFLLLKGSPYDPQFHKSLWYVVTGSCEEEDKDFIDTVKREVKEETNLQVIDSMYLNWIFKYNSLGVQCIERVYFSKVNSGNIALNEESIDYKWCNLDEFIQKIDWFGDKKILDRVLKKALISEIYFKNEQIESFK